MPGKAVFQGGRREQRRGQVQGGLRTAHLPQVESLKTRASSRQGW